jgi:hypothetical protein
MMTTLTQTNDNLLRNALRGNSVFSVVRGLIMIFDAGLFANFMGIESTIPFIVIGIGLLLYAAMLYINTTQRPINKTFGWYAVIADGVWVLASAIVLLTDAFTLTSEGKWLVLIIADMVLLFAIVQYIGIRRMK